MIDKVSNIIKAARVMAGLTQEQLADILKYERQAISRMENGKRKVDLSEIKLIAEATNQPIDFFIKKEPIAKNDNYVDVSDLKDEDILVLQQMADCLRKKYSSEKSA